MITLNQLTCIYFIFYYINIEYIDEILEIQDIEMDIHGDIRVHKIIEYHYVRYFLSK